MDEFKNIKERLERYKMEWFEEDYEWELVADIEYLVDLVEKLIAEKKTRDGQDST